MNNDKDLFRQALQRQNERAARMKMPDDLEQRIMERIGSQKTNRPWLYPAIVAVAASILLLLVFRFSQGPVEEKPIMQQPVLAKTIGPSTPQPAVSEPIIEEEKEEVLAVVQPTKQPVKKRRKAVRKQSTSIKEPMPTETEIMPLEELPPSYNPTIQDPFLVAAEFAREIRTQGERLNREITQMITQ